MVNSLTGMTAFRAGQRGQLQVSSAHQNQDQGLKKTQSVMLSRMLKGMSLDGTGMLIDIFA
jgi:hypothetical protein